MADEGIGERIVVDIFTALIGVGSVCALTGAVLKIFLRPPKVWEEEDDGLSNEMEVVIDYDELRKQNPHIWMNEIEREINE